MVISVQEAACHARRGLAYNGMILASKSRCERCGSEVVKITKVMSVLSNLLRKHCCITWTVPIVQTWTRCHLVVLSYC